MEEKSFDRGTQLSIFASDRLEDIGALVAALILAISIMLVVGQS